MEYDIPVDVDILTNSSSFYCKTAKYQENVSDSFLKLSLLRRTTSQLGSLSYLISDNKVTCTLLDGNLKRYFGEVDDKQGVNTYAEEVQALLKYSKKAQCQTWKSGLSINCDKQLQNDKHIPSVLCESSDCHYSSDNFTDNAGSEDDIQFLLDSFKDVGQTDLVGGGLSTKSTQISVQNVNKQPVNSDSCHAFHQKRKHDSLSRDDSEIMKNKKVEQNHVNRFKPSAGVGESKQDHDKQKPSVSLLTFKTASAELRAQNLKKFGNERAKTDTSSNSGYPPQKRNLGLRPKAVNSRFVNPIKSNNNDREVYDGDKNDCEHSSQEDIDPRLQHIEPKMIELIRSEIMDCTSPITWDDIAGLHFAKSTIQEIVVWPMLRPDIFTGLRRPPKGILLFGPPGTGKTLIAKCIASQSKSTFFSISASSLTSKWIGDGEKMVRALFAVARVDQPSVVFIDEIDSLLSKRSDTEHESSRRIKTEFLVQLDGATSGEEDRLLIIGATNRPYELDEAARRRLVKRLYIPLPDLEARVEMVTRLMSKEKNSLGAEDIKWIGDLTDGYSGADVKILCQEAALGPIRSISFGQIEHISHEQVRPVTLDDFKNALNRVKSSVSPDDLKCYIDWDKTYGSGSQ